MSGEPSLPTQLVKELREKLGANPLFARAVPFFIFLGLTFGQGAFGESSRYWMYLVKTIIAVPLLWLVWPLVQEMRWKFSIEGLVCGVAVCAMWIGIDPYYKHFGEIGKPWNPNAQFGEGSTLAWVFIAARLLGSSILVPPLEEAFYRSLVYRYIVNPDFTKIALGVFVPIAFFITAAVFGFAHYEWLAGILCAFAYQGLVIWKKRLGDAMFAHAVTNFLLGVWVVWKGDWRFW